MNVLIETVQKLIMFTAVKPSEAHGRRPQASRGFQAVKIIRPKKKDSCVQVSEVKKIRVGRLKNIFILDFFFHYKCTEVVIEDRVLEVSFFNQSAHGID